MTEQLIADAASPGQPPARAGGRRARHPILSTLGRRTLYAVATLVVVSILIFLATSALPGDVADIVLGRGASPERLAALQHQLGLDQPLVVRYLGWLGGVLRGDLGNSAVALAQSAPDPSISSMIGGPLLNSVVLATIAMLLLIPLSLGLGVYSATHEGRPADQISSYVWLVFGCLPEFVLGTLLIVVFSRQLGLFPPIALLRPGQSPLANLPGLVLPVLTLLGVAVAFAARQVRAAMAVTLRQDYVLMGRLNGLPERMVRRRYALRNALASTVQTYAQAVQYLFGGVIVVEALFAYPGIGTLLVQSVTRRDTPTVAGIALILAAAYIAINIIADVLVVFLVPKLRTGAHR
ncbi:ABC transporter permease [Pseudonocardia sp. CA-107938]|uniref:ABC transporter permease n=1 Tax=Pseudonocardia sp. CA-107938 TaxID=3240021 RepID=UPI003D89FDA8